MCICRLLELVNNGPVPHIDGFTEVGKGLQGLLSGVEEYDPVDETPEDCGEVAISISSMKEGDCWNCILEAGDGGDWNESGCL